MSVTVPRDRVVTNGDVQLAVRDHGGTGPALVLVHGHWGNLASFDGLGPLLTDMFRVVAYDQRGHGRSDSGPVTTDGYIDDLVVVCQRLDIAQPILYGQSFGSLICLAAIHAEAVEVQAFVNEDGWIADPDPPGDAPLSRGRRLLDKEMLGAFRRGAAEVGAAGTATLDRATVALGDGQFELRATDTELTEKVLAFWETPVSDIYRTLGAPTLLLAAVPGDDADHDARRAAVHQTAQETSGPFEVRWFETDHWISAIDPKGVAAALRDFAATI